MPTDPEAAEACHGEGSMLFIQIGCIYTTAELNTRYNMGLAMGILSILIALVVLAYAEAVKYEFKKYAKKFDENTVMVQNYAVEFKLKYPKDFKFPIEDMSEFHHILMTNLNHEIHNSNATLHPVFHNHFSNVAKPDELKKFWLQSNTNTRMS